MYQTIIWVIVSGLSSALAPVAVKKYIETSNYYFILVACIAYIVSIITFVYIFKNKNVSVLFTIIKGLSIVLVISYGVIFFGEKLNTIEWIGVCLVLLGIFLLFMSESKEHKINTKLLI